MKYEKLKPYGKKFNKNIKVGKWLFVVGIVLGGTCFFLSAMLNEISFAIACLAILVISLEMSISFIESAERYKEHIRQALVSIVFETLKNNCQNDGFYSIYWNHSDILIIYGRTDESEQAKIEKKVSDAISIAIKETGLKIQFEIDLNAKEN